MQQAPPPQSQGLSEETRKALDLHRQRVAESLKQLEASMPAWTARLRKL